MSKWSLKEKLQKMEAFKVVFPVEAGNMAVNQFVGSFRDQGFTDQAIVKWKPRKSKKDDIGRAILVKTGALRRSIKRGYTSWVRTVIQSVGLVYAEVHNYGLKSGRGKGFNMPKRQFMGHSAKLDKDITVKMKSQVDKIML